MCCSLLVAVSLIGLNRAGALTSAAPAAAPTSSTNTIPYQGRIANASGQAITGTQPMIFRLYNVASGGTHLWEEQWTGPNSVRVSDGLFNVMLGSLNGISQAIITGNPSLWLGITVGSDNEMTPRVQLGSVPFATQALTVPDGSITNSKLAEDARVRIEELFASGATQPITVVNPFTNWVWVPETRKTITLTKTSKVHINHMGHYALDSGSYGIYYCITVNASCNGRSFTDFVSTSRYTPMPYTAVMELSPGTYIFEVAVLTAGTQQTFHLYNSTTTFVIVPLS